MAMGVILAVVRYGAGIASVANINNAYPWGWWVGYGIMVLRCARCHNEETLGLMVLKTQPERVATIRRMAALPGSGVRPDQVLTLVQAFETLISQ